MLSLNFSKNMLDFICDPVSALKGSFRSQLSSNVLLIDFIW